MKRFWSFIFCLAFLLGLGAAKASKLAAFTLRDFLGREWRNELVQFPFTPAQHQHATAGHALLGPNGESAPYQLVTDPVGKGDLARRSPGKGAKIAFLADLDPFETRAYRFAEAAVAAKTDLQVEETADVIRIVNSRIGISIRKTLAEGHGPIESMRLGPADKWIGGSSLPPRPRPEGQAGGTNVVGFTTEILARGPALAEVIGRAKFAKGGWWEIRFRAYANEPVVLVDESFDLAEPSNFRISFTSNFSPTHVFYRHGKDVAGKIATWKIEPSDKAPVSVFVLVPWLPWWESEREGLWFGLYNESDPGMLTIGAREASVWIDPARPVQEQWNHFKTVARLEDHQLAMTFPLQRGTRKWMIAAPDKEASLAALQDKNLHRAPLPQQYLIKHSDFPLDRVKDYVLQWPDADRVKHPRLLFRKADLARFRGADMKETTAYYFATGDKQIGESLAKSALGLTQHAVNMYLNQGDLRAPGFAPHHQTVVLSALNVADVALSGDALSPEMRERLRAQLAFVGYVVDRADYWSPERGFAANPNMTTTMRAYRAGVGCLLPTHPLAAVWRKDGLDELKQELYENSDASGGWLEAPHYALVSYDYLLGCFLMGYNGGHNRFLLDPRMKKVVEWLAKTSTPPDSRVAGLRHLAPVGNTYIGHLTGVFGIVANVWKDRDPLFASQMQWMYQQQGSLPEISVGGSHPTMGGYRKMLIDPSIPAQAPRYGSELFPENGVVLRNQYPSDRETMLHMIAGSHYQHYDYDSGSITLWGKGRVLADEFGYYARAPVEDHSMVETPLSAGLDLRVKEFMTSAPFDYARGVLSGWTRQIAFVKDADPLAPNYFVVCDRLAVPAPATWRLWLTCNKIVLGPQCALVEGKEDVDMDVFFFGMPADSELKTEERTRKSHGVRGAPSNGTLLDITQTGLIAKLPRGRGWAVILYPRLNTEKPPVFTALADGQAVKVQTGAGTDYVFLSERPFQFQEGDITFEGMAGAIQLRGTNVVLSLGAAGRVTARGRTLKSDKPSPPMTANLIKNGDGESGGPILQDHGEGLLLIKVEKGNPVKGDKSHSGKHYLSLRLKGQAQSGSHAIAVLPQELFVDPTKTYRISLQAHTDADLNDFVISIGGYASGLTGRQVVDSKGSAWEYVLSPDPDHNVEAEWTTYQIIIGPAGTAGANIYWLPDTLAVSFFLRIQKGNRDTMFYVDNIAMEEIPSTK